MACLKYLWICFLVAVAVLTALWPQLDVAGAQLFYADGFAWRGHPLTNFIHDCATGWPPKVIGGGLVAGLFMSVIRKKSPRPWLFLLLALLLGSGVLANIVLKDNWGRARPTQIVAFGGKAAFTPYWQPTAQCQNNCSFVNGDASFGFILPAPALLLRRRRRLMFWCCTGAGAMFGVTRMMMGAHFLSDTVWAALLMLGVMFVLYAVLYGRKAARSVWRAL